MKESLARLRREPQFAHLIQKYGAPKLRRGRSPFQSLARAIIYQQISGKAAASIYQRLVASFGISLDTPIDWESKQAELFPTPEQMLAASDESLRTAGLSPQKTKYLKDLAQKFSDGTVAHATLHTLTNGEIVDSLTRVKGIGVWTVHMFLIFTLNRLDVLPTGDLGIQKGFQIVYKLRSLPSPRTMERLAKPWRKDASVASWYLWRVADEAKK